MDMDFNLNQLRAIIQNNIKYLDSAHVIDEIKNEVLDRICSIELVLEEKLSEVTEEERKEVEDLMALIRNVKNKHIPKKGETSKVLS